MQGTLVPSLIWGDPTCFGATEPMHHSYWSPCTLEPMLRNEKPFQWEACALQQRVDPTYCNKDPPNKINKFILKNNKSWDWIPIGHSVALRSKWSMSLASSLAIWTLDKPFSLQIPLTQWWPARVGTLLRRAVGRAAQGRDAQRHWRTIEKVKDFYPESGEGDGSPRSLALGLPFPGVEGLPRGWGGLKARSTEVEIQGFLKGDRLGNPHLLDMSWDKSAAF